MKLSIPVVATTLEQAKKDFKRIAEFADVVELRIDNIPNLTSDGLKDLMTTKVTIPACVTNRSEEEGGKFAGPESARVKLLEYALEHGAEYVDVELATGTQIIKRFLEKKRPKQQIVVSYHNFTQTPSFAVLEKVMQRQIDAGASICKIVTFANSPEDNIQIFKLIEAANQIKQPIVSMCMGKLGQISRLTAPLLGSYWTFACEKAGGESAPGQIDYKTMLSVWKIFT